MSRYEDSTLDCQGCGDTIKVLTPAEAQAVAHNPENYILFCRLCKRDDKHIEPEYRF